MMKPGQKVDLRLYGLIDAGEACVEKTVAAARGGATLIQLRDKAASKEQLISVARQMKAALGAFGVPLLINDDVDVAQKSGADGVHLGQEDEAVEVARDRLGDQAIIGLTLKNDQHIAAAPVALLNYGAIGGVFETISKNNPDPPVGLEGLKHLSAELRARQSDLPIVAIAGIDETNAGQVINAGADGISVISALFSHADVEARARLLRGIVDEALRARTEEQS